MTNRIDELWGQALDRAVPETYSSLTWTQVERIKAVFAELIVRECGVALNPPVQNRNVISREQAYNLIKKHFGVEE